MKARLAAWLERRWYGGVAPAWPLRVLAAAYGLVVRRRRRAFLRTRSHSPRAGLPVIVVGNLSVGGAGKTPLVLALIEALRARGWQPGVISRGYGGRAPGPERVLPGSDPARVGDEPCLIASRSGAPVAIARRRAEALELLERSHEVDLVVADDGLQHYALPRDFEILVTDGRRRFGNGLLLPAGPLREPAERAADCDFRVVNGGTAEADEVPMQLVLDDARSLDESATRPLQEFEGQRVHAVAGIGDPQRFFDALQARGIEVVPHPFPDHHAFRATDLRFAEHLPLLMTEKDAVKCRAFAAPGRWFVPVRGELPEPFIAALDARLRRIAGATA
jgi:tetraacyldisaccharide 4'-kinase